MEKSSSAPDSRAERTKAEGAKALGKKHLRGLLGDFEGEE